VLKGSLFSCLFDDVFSISGRGTIVLGNCRKEERSRQEIQRDNRNDRLKYLNQKIKAIEALGQMKQEAKKGSNIVYI
jgi:translation elongation factor EF-Tu-like GTPase